MEKADGGWTVELNNDNLPRLLVNRQYYAEINEAARRKEDKAYISECLQSANWLIKALDQRARTILSVASELVRQQDGFLARGVPELRPLNLRAIAEVVGMHESTVSRVTSNKYVATPRGVFELKFFFTSALASSDGGENHSSEAVREQMRDLIENEAPTAILSDDKLVEILRLSGVAYCPAHGNEISGRFGHSLFGATPQGQALGGACGRLTVSHTGPMFPALRCQGRNSWWTANEMASAGFSVDHFDPEPAKSRASCKSLFQARSPTWGRPCAAMLMNGCNQA